jgi:hypothetical protein
LRLSVADAIRDSNDEGYAMAGDACDGCRDMIFEIAAEFRAELEEFLGIEDDPDCMVGRCRDASRELAERLLRSGIEARAVFGRYLEVADGYADLVASRSEPSLDACDVSCDDEDGAWLHWFVVCGDLLVDVTADQFRLAEERDDYRVVVTGTDDPRYSTGAVRQAAPRR